MTEVEIQEIFGKFNTGEKMEEMIAKLIDYERALAEVENAFYKWRFDKLKQFGEYFIWERIKDNSYIGFSKLTYFALLEKLKKYARVLPKSELFYEEQRARKLSKIHKENGK